MPITPTHKIWMNGQLVDWEDAKIHILTHTLHYGTGVFEGIRAYETSRGPAVFRLTDHIVRLFNSAKIMMMDMPYSVDELVAATKATVKSTGLPSCYVRPIAYYGLRRDGAQHAAVLGRRGDRVLAMGRVSRRRRRRKGRPYEDQLVDAARSQHDAAGIEDHRQLRQLVAGQGRGAQGRLRRGDHVEPAGSRQRVHRRKYLLCAQRPHHHTTVVVGRARGITQASVNAIARDLGYEIIVGDLARSDLYVAEEIFVCGTAAEISSVNSVDDRDIPCPGPITKSIADIYTKAVRGQVDRYKDWVEHVDE
jgi:branched-chain amino acid aminotransferase